MILNRAHVNRTLFVGILLLFSVSAGSVSAQDPGIPDTVTVISVEVNAGEHFPVTVRAYTDEPLASGTLGFRWGTPDLFLDSVSYVGSILTAEFPRFTQSLIDNTTNYQCLTGFTIFFEAPVSASEGVWATLWFTADPAAADQVIDLDSIFVPPAGEFIFIDHPDFAEFTPQFKGGTITIGNPMSNTPPVLAPIGPKTVEEGQLLEFLVSATDAESTPTLFAENLPTNATFVDSGNGNGSFRFLADFNQSGNKFIRFFASDSEFADTEFVTISVINVNRAPILSTIGSKAVNEGNTLSFLVTGGDPDGDEVILSATPLPPNASFTDNGNGTGFFEFTPDFDQSGVISVTFAASDGSLSDSEVVSITVNNINRPPVLAPIGNQSVDEGSNLNILLTASDPDGGPLTFQVSPPLPANASLTDHGDGTATLDFSPDFTQAGVTIHDFAVLDGDGAADGESVTITVNDVNRAPVLAAIGSQIVNEGETLIVEVLASDPDGNALTLSASVLPLNASYTDNNNGTGTFIFSPGFDQSGLYSITFAAFDGNLADSETVSITVNNVNRPPVITVPGAQAVQVGDTLSFGVSGFDPDGNGGSLQFAALNLPTGATFTPGLIEDTYAFDWIPSSGQAGLYAVTFITSEFSGELADTAQVNITVTDAPVPDSAFISVDTLFFSIQEGTEIVATGCAELTSTNQPAAYTGSVSELDGFTTLLDVAGNTNDSVCAQVVAGTLTPGVYYNHLEFNVDGVENNPVTLVTSLTVTETPVPDSAFVTPDTLEFTIPADSFADIPPMGCAYLTSTNAPANYTAVAVDSGISAFVFPSNITGQTNDSVCVYLNLPVPEGIYYNSILYTVDGVSNNPVELVVKITAEAPPIPDSAFVEPDTLFFTIDEATDVVLTDCAFLSSTNAPAQYTGVVLVSFTNLAPPGADTAHLPFTTLIDSAGMTDDSVCVQVSAGALSPGKYYNDIHFTVEGVSNNPIVLVSCLTVTAAPVPDSAFVMPDTVELTVDADAIYIVPITGCTYLTSTNAPANYKVAPADTGILSFTFPSDTSGQTNDTACFYLASPIPEGVYYNSLLYTVEGVDNNPVELVVKITAVAQPPPDTSILSLSDSVFVFNSSVDTQFIGGDSLRIFNVGTGPDFGWSITKHVCSFTSHGDSLTTGSDGSWVSISPLSGATPEYSFISVDNEGLSAGTYHCAFEVSAEAGVLNSPQMFDVILNVAPTPQGPVSVMTIFDTAYYYEVTEGDSGLIHDSVLILNTGDGPEFGWRVSDVSCSFLRVCGPDEFCTPVPFPDSLLGFIGNLSGITPSSFRFTITPEFLLPGNYVCEIVVSADSGVVNAPQTIFAELRVNPLPPPPSSDTLYVSTVPGTPGSKVKVPVNLINQGPICSLFVNLEWGSAQIFLDSISFEGTRLEGIASTETSFDNGSRTLLIEFSAANFALPAGSGKVANLYFDIFSGITDAGVVPITLNSLPACPACVLGAHNCITSIIPQFFPGGIVIDSSANVVCGRVVDTAGNEIPGARVQIWDNFPQGMLFAEDTTDFNGSFKFNQLYVVPYTVYAFAEGYYPNTVEDINFGTLGLEVVLTPVSPVHPTNEWIDFYCDRNFFMGLPLPIGSVIDAFDPDGDHVGSWYVTEAGKYGLMPIYRDDAFTEEDDGADPGDIITMYINGMPAEATGDRIWTQNGDRFEVCLNFDGSSDKTIFLVNGWNLISWNLDTEVDDVEMIFGSIMQYIDVILSFEEVGLTYDPDLAEFSTLTSADHLHGYWVRIENPFRVLTQLNLSGLTALVNTPIHLEAGWNLVSYLPPVSLPTGSALVSQEGNLRVALGFDGEGQTYEPDLLEFSTLTEMNICFGYWLKVFESSTLIYPGFNSSPFIDNGGAEMNRPGALAKLGVEGKLTPTNNWVDIYSANLTVDGQSVSAGTSVKALDAGGALVGYGLVSASGKLNFTPVYASDESSGLKPGAEFSLIVGELEINETITFTARGERIELPALSSGVSGEILPESYSLSQNYPNPFNPETKITFGLSQAGEVSLEVFNVLGAKIATIAQGQYPAGSTTVTWNGRNDSGESVASGMYFYRLKSANFVQTRKMILLK